jgi:hypothetical protein
MVSEDRKYLWKDIHKVVNKIGWIHKSTSKPDMRQRCIAYQPRTTPGERRIPHNPWRQNGVSEIAICLDKNTC